MIRHVIRTFTSGIGNALVQTGASRQLVPAMAGPRPRQSNDAQLRYLSQAAYLEEAGAPHYLSGVALTACLGVAAFIAWSACTNVTEVAHAPGQVVPSGFEQVVQHLDGGIVKTINVKEGDLVEQGQSLLTVDDGVTFESLQRAKAKLTFLELSQVRLRALYDVTSPDWQSVPNAAAEDISAQTDLYKSAMEEQRGQEKIVEEQIEQKRTAEIIFAGQLDTTRKNLELTEKIFQARRDLFAKDLIAFPVFAKAQQDFIVASGEIDKIKDQIKQNSEGLTELTHRLDAIRRSARLETATKINETSSEITQIKSTIAALQLRFERFDVKAPVRGYVKAMQVNTLGGVLGSGQTVMSIVPTDEELVVEVKIAPADIGHVHPGQLVHVKFSAFDFTRYGTLNGRIDRISASAIGGPNGEQSYRARVLLDAKHLGHLKDEQRVIPGMTVMADIQTGEKSVLDYLMKPIKSTSAMAFTER